MKIEMPKQSLHLDINVREDYPVMWHTDAKGDHVNDLTITPVKGTIDITCDVELDTGDLKVTDVLSVMKAFTKLQRYIRKVDKKRGADFAAGFDEDGRYVCHKLR